VKADMQARYERQVFRAFAASAGLRVVARSVRSTKPRRPDITCRIDHDCRIAFEIVQVVDKGVVRRQSDQRHLQARLREARDALPQSQRDRLRGNLHNALVAVEFLSSASRRAREAVVSAIINALEQVDSNTTGELPLAGLRPVVTRLSINRGNFGGPSFQVLAGGFFDDPVVELVRAKFSKSYRASTPIELLVFYHSQRIAPDVLWLPQLNHLVTRSLSCSPFRRVWVYDAIGANVRYVYPTCGVGSNLAMEADAKEGRGSSPRR
jgi:hypothetical protein